jgi:hypothetical protein
VCPPVNATQDKTNYKVQADDYGNFANIGPDGFSDN